jgi:formate hydrogenlyase subunit 4
MDRPGRRDPVSALLALVSQILHIALMLAVAPAVDAVLWRLDARLAGHPGPPLIQPWRDLARLLRKQTVWPENGSAVSRAAPPVILAVTLAAVSLVPSFTLGMAFAPLADLLTVVFLLVLARAITVLAAADIGTAAGALAGRRAMSLTSLAEPVLVLVVFAFAVLAGTGNIDLIAAAQREAMPGSGAAPALAIAALAAVAFADLHEPPDALDREFTGPDIALLRIARSLRLLVWLNLLSALFLPIGMAPPESGPVAWAAGLGCWAVKLVLLLAALAGIRAATGRLGMQRQAALIGVALVLGAVAAVLALAGAGTA